jgi:threonylcarbamoyladenosine tRNA methylthiotransferase MtaB
MRKVSFKTIGCRLNKAETAKITANFVAAGYEIVAFRDNADVCIIHTCTITGVAEKECIRLARSIKRQNPATFVIMAGCAAEVEQERLQKESGADLIAGQNTKYNLPQIINETLSLPPIHGYNSHTPTVPIFDTTRSWLKVQDGCSFKCAYCIVPLTRGPSRSIPFSEIIAEAESFANAGFKEIVITGVNIGCYRDDNKKLVDIIKEIEKINEIKRIRISSIEITTTERAIIEHMAESAKLCNFLHFPLQTGDNKLLKSMGRLYSADDYRELIEFVIETVPGVGLGTDIITGLPGEDETAFENTFQLIKDFPFSNLHVFPYSIRKNTRAAEMDNHIPHNISKKRTEKLIQLGNSKKQAFAESFIGKPVTILTERIKDDGTVFGWTEEYIAAKIKQPGIISNQIISFTPTAYHNGKLIKQ